MSGTIPWTVALAFSAMVAVGDARAQYAPPLPPLTSAPCVPTKKEPCPVPPAPAAPASPAKQSAAEEFPFPGDAPAPDAPTPTKADPASPANSAAAEHPFPEDSPSSSSTSSSSSSSSSSDASGDAKDDDTPTLKDLGSQGIAKSQRRRLAKVEDPEDREAEDLKVSKFYEDRGNFRAAYLRAQDAVKTLPDDPEAHLRLAQTAEKMQKKEEAVAEYNAYLKLDPQGEKVKSVREALAEIR